MKTTAITVLGVAAAAMSACFILEGDPDLSGSWRYNASVGDGASGVSCNTGGTIHLTHSDDAFWGELDGTTVCIDGSGVDTSIAGPFPVTNGRVTGDRMTFDLAGCSLDGIIESGDRLSGDAVCTTDAFGSVVSLPGAWQAGR